LLEVWDASVWGRACSRTHLDGEKYFCFSEQTPVKLPPKLPPNLPTKFCASRKNNVLIIKEGLEPEALDEINLKMGKIMGMSRKELILTHCRPKFRMNEILCILQGVLRSGT
jgi:hypothetical protein